MNICILGWYGTETLGDRAILDGILIVFSKSYGKAHAAIGSLNPFFTRRTMAEDGGIHAVNAPGISVGCFDVKNAHVLRREIRKADVVLMGGGPIMDLDELNIICYAFKYARMLGIRTIVFGCGLGPLYKKVYLRLSERLLGYADDIIFRDRLSAEAAAALFGGRGYRYAFDPAVVSVGEFMKTWEPRRGDCITVNLREFPVGIYGQTNRLTRDHIKSLLTGLSERFGSVVLVPMHTFGMGGDDRRLFAELLCGGEIRNVSAIHTPQNLYELYATFSNSFGCIGMRYHSVLMQALLNGNNIVLDYTEKGAGKTCGFLDMLGSAGEFYKNRYWNTQEEIGEGSIGQIAGILAAGKRLEYDRGIFEETLGFYRCVVR